MTTDREPLAVDVRCFPSGDRAFARATRTAIDDGVASVADARVLRDIVDARLREAYPNSRIVPQEDFATLGRGAILWYVYRDGRVRKPDARRDRMYEAVGEARRTVANTEVTMGHSRDIAHQAGFEGRPPIPGPPLRTPSGPQQPRPQARSRGRRTTRPEG